MDALQPTRILCLIVLFFAICAASAHNVPPEQDHAEDKKLELYDGVFVSIPKDNSTGRILSFELDTGTNLNEGKRYILLQSSMMIYISGIFIEM